MGSKAVSFCVFLNFSAELSRARDGGHKPPNARGANLARRVGRQVVAAQSLRPRLSIPLALGGSDKNPYSMRMSLRGCGSPDYVESCRHRL
ncbi:hypothetical protein BQ8794_240283 [Mesorhizobium prunaredense]|uniref:Uncharacterized protein n=1 Tax=Mesorhizobium prunaredense TaxID=1631249 RepID=A0A1R3V838_9HYPH|nr:hypothetical protein BQ8794_240283 [Mesorhizobium prunaredense]